MIVLHYGKTERYAGVYHVIDGNRLRLITVNRQEVDELLKGGVFVDFSNDMSVIDSLASLEVQLVQVRVTANDCEALNVRLKEIDAEVAKTAQDSGLDARLQDS